MSAAHVESCDAPNAAEQQIQLLNEVSAHGDHPVNWLDPQVEDHFRTFFSKLGKSRIIWSNRALYRNLHATCRRWRLIFPLRKAIINGDRYNQIDDAVQVLHWAQCLYALSLSRSQSDTEAFVRILDGAISSEMLHSIQLYDFTLKENAAKAISNALSRLPLLTSLSITRIRDPSGHILSFLPLNTTIRKLALEGRSATEKAPLEHVFSALQQESRTIPLQKLTLRGLFIKSDDLIAMSHGIASLIDFRCRLLGVQSDGVAALATNAIAKSKSLKRLDLQFSNIDSATMNVLIDSIRQSPAAIQTVHIENRKPFLDEYDSNYGLNSLFESFGAESIRQLLQDSFGLKSLDLTGNTIANVSDIFKPLLSISAALTRLALRSMNADQYAFTSLFSALRRVPNIITYLDLRGNSPGAEGIRAVAEFLSENPPLQSLFLSSCEIDSAGFEDLSSALRKNTVLERLNVDGNRAGSQGAIALATALALDNNSLCFLDLGLNNIGFDASEALANLLASNKRLCQLALHDNLLTPKGRKMIEAVHENTPDSNIIDLDMGGTNELDEGEF